MVDITCTTRFNLLDMTLDTLFFVLVWICAVPPAASLITFDIVEEELFASFTAWIDRRYRGTLLGKLFRCKRCLGHHIVGIFWIMYLPIWISLSDSLWMSSVASIILYFCACRITVKIFPAK